MPVAPLKFLAYEADAVRAKNAHPKQVEALIMYD